MDWNQSRQRELGVKSLYLWILKATQVNGSSWNQAEKKDWTWGLNNWGVCWLSSVVVGNLLFVHFQHVFLFNCSLISLHMGRYLLWDIPFIIPLISGSLLPFPSNDGCWNLPSTGSWFVHLDFCALWVAWHWLARGSGHIWLIPWFGSYSAWYPLLLLCSVSVSCVPACCSPNGASNVSSPPNEIGTLYILRWKTGYNLATWSISGGTD